MIVLKFLVAALVRIFVLIPLGVVGLFALMASALLVSSKKADEFDGWVSRHFFALERWCDNLVETKKTS